MNHSPWPAVRPALMLMCAVALMPPGARAGEAPDLTGTWRLDAARSEILRPAGPNPAPRGDAGMGGGPGGWAGHPGGGGWGGGRGDHGWSGGTGPRGGEGDGGGEGGGGGESGRAGGAERPRFVLLPDLFHLTQSGPQVSFEDSTGVVMQEIATVSAEHDTLLHAPSAQVVYGQWKGPKLEVERRGPRGNTVTQSFSLGDHGESLIIEIKVPAHGPMPARTVRRVYTRVKES